MPTTRKRVARGTAVPSEIRLILGLGCGFSTYPRDWLKEQWTIWHVELTEYWQRNFEKDPFAAIIARREGWPPYGRKPSKT